MKMTLINAIHCTKDVKTLFVSETAWYIPVYYTLTVKKHTTKSFLIKCRSVKL